MVRARAAALLGLLAAVALTASADATPGRADALPTRVPGTLTVGVDIGTVGLAVGTFQNGVIMHAHGFEIDLARALARRSGLKLKLVEVPFADTFAAGPKSFDVALSHVTITAERRKSVDFSSPYFVVNKGVLLAPGVTPPRSLADLRKLRICVQEKTTSLSYVVTDLHPTRPPRAFPSPVDALLALSDGFCQAMVADLEILVAAKRDQPDLYGSIGGQIATHEHYGAVFEKGSKLRAPIGAALAALTRSGAVERLAARWFGAGWDRAPILRQ
jgi:polar amino acid transport system substrate-binding protein